MQSSQILLMNLALCDQIYTPDHNVIHAQQLSHSIFTDISHWNEVQLQRAINNRQYQCFEVLIRFAERSDFTPTLFVFNLEQKIAHIYSDLELSDCKIRHDHMVSEGIKLPLVIKQHLHAMQIGDVQQSVAHFDTNGEFVHSNGKKVQGYLNLANEFQEMFASNGLDFIPFQIMNDEQTYILFASMMDLHTASVYELSAGHKIKSLRSYM
ncbi:hypothetical protein RFI02_12185 [Acinetobacter sichuanensis]|uniref:hypothetical protein n=1 Tax=Acinetobacter sichuanensis TaxID=2136183 RepID=UPI00280FABB9|nr:hypothetical protein [Acinetobacter sichuanensis]MDQ9021865.1 hypothetical protein [Acinetobacter sichuanensis]